MKDFKIKKTKMRMMLIYFLRETVENEVFIDGVRLHKIKDDVLSDYKDDFKKIGDMIVHQ